jgi:hypothetical protein
MPHQLSCSEFGPVELSEDTPLTIAPGRQPWMKALFRNRDQLRKASSLLTTQSQTIV